MVEPSPSVCDFAKRLSVDTPMTTILIIEFTSGAEVKVIVFAL